ncbi:dienelactone hydrolase family protein [Schlesneria sp. DSM 10557]|uniref:dienelactone hydrolase family protein n=1 Tax=Schlesneria sp. DSM 10557 TaxID=3044399 RepID=UPI0035A0D5B0
MTLRVCIPLVCHMALLFVRPLSLHAGELDVRWLGEVQKSPQREVSFDVGFMEPLLMRKSGGEVHNPDEWQERRRELIEAWDDFLGPSPQTPEGIATQLLKSESVGGVIRDLIRYECEPNLFVEAYLLRPAHVTEGTLLPGIVALHHTAQDTIDEIAGVSGPDSRKLGLKLAQRGFVVICPRCFLWQDAPSLTAAVDRYRARHPESLGMRKMLFDARRAVDILEAQPHVDRTRIGAVGHSLGAKEVLYLAAFDERIKAAVASEGGMALKSTNWDAPWYLGPQIHEASFGRNHHELVALIAPRAFLVLGGETGPGAADGDRSWPLIGAALPVYRLFSDSPRLGLLNHGQGHTIPDDVYERLAEWLGTYLSQKAVAALKLDGIQVDTK